MFTPEEIQRMIAEARERGKGAALPSLEDLALCDSGNGLFIGAVLLRDALDAAATRPDLHDPTTSRSYTLADVRVGRRWRHYRGGEYETVSLARESTNGPRDGGFTVIYRNSTGEFCTRAAEEFLDGRFTPIGE